MGCSALMDMRMSLLVSVRRFLGRLTWDMLEFYISDTILIISDFSCMLLSVSVTLSRFLISSCYRRAASSLILAAFSFLRLYASLSA